MDFLVNLDVDDLERGVDFYSSLFGLQVGRRLGGFAVELLGGPGPPFFLPKEGRGAPAPQGHQPPPLRPPTAAGALGLFRSGI